MYTKLLLVVSDKKNPSFLVASEEKNHNAVSFAQTLVQAFSV